MSKYVLTYSGGGGMAATPEELAKSMNEWNAWFGTMGADLVDVGNPFGPGKAITADGSVSDATGGLSGYSVVTAAGLDAAVAVAKGCPVLSSGGALEVYEAIDM